jgi:hypothetical protein
MPKGASTRAQGILSRNRRLTREGVFYTPTEETAIKKEHKIKKAEIRRISTLKTKIELYKIRARTQRITLNILALF